MNNQRDCMPDTNGARLEKPTGPDPFVKFRVFRGFRGFRGCYSGFRVPAVAIATLCAVLSTAPAEEPAAEIPRHARFLAVGDSPPFRQEIRDGVRYELDPPPGSIPPREVVPGFAGKPSEPVPLRLGRISPPVVVPAGEGPLLLQRAGDAPDALPWVSLKSPETGDFLVMLWRDPKSASWQRARSLVVAEAPAGHARIVNLFPQPVRMLWGAESVLLPPGDAILRPIPQNKAVLLKILTADASGAMKRYYSGSVSANSAERCLVTTYRADGEAPRRPLKVSILREPAIATTQDPKGGSSSE